MQAILLLALAFQIPTDSSSRPDSSRVTATRTVQIGAGEAKRKGSEPRRIPVTGYHLQTAFKSPAARSLLLRARAARMSQDSALQSYEAANYFRISAGLGISRIGRDRLIFRHESVSHVKWMRGVGAWVDVTGARTVLPAGGDVDDEGDEDFDPDIAPLPYYPGQEPLLSFGEGDMVKSQVDERDLVHPLAEGAEAYYTYEAGDSVMFRLPDGSTVRLRELEVRPRVARWNVVVGSLWFDVATGQLVRAAYRLAVPMDVWAIVNEEDSTAQDDIPAWVKPIISPMHAQVSAIAMEYGLYQGRFWLLRLRSIEGGAQVSFMRVPFRMEQRVQYTSVNAIDSLPEIAIAEPEQPPDSLPEVDQEKWRDSVSANRRELRRAQRDSVRRGLRTPPPRCDSTGVHVMTRRMSESNVRIATRVPCDRVALENSPELPKSIFDEGEELFGVAERDALLKEALSMGAQAPFAFGSLPPTLEWGLQFTRYNRVEGFSTGAQVDQRLGAGYILSLLARLGHADLEPNAELTLARSNSSVTIRGRAYNRLVSASDWGNPLSFGSSLSALLFGRDEGFYYRASGAEIEWQRERGSLLTWRAFAERQRTAGVENDFSIGGSFIPNIAARTGSYAGLSTRFLHTRGLDPNGFRVFTDLRLESAMSDSANAAYGRGALDLTFTQGIGGITSALTVAGGASVGDVPPQRLWYMGGTSTVRGQRASPAASGNAFWLGRLEMGGSVPLLRPVVFGDVGWVGDRVRWRNVGRPMSGVGVGASILDGLLRFDIARGLFPQKRVRVDMYLDAKF